MNTINYEELKGEFSSIANKGWIKAVNKSDNAVGLTFESLLSKPADSMFFPDYHGIEIKCSQRFSRYPYILFSLAFDGPTLYTMNEVLIKYGKDDYEFPGKKLLFGDLSTEKYTLINNKYYFKLVMDSKEKILAIDTYNLNYEFIERAAFINYATIKERLEIKMSHLALVFASKKYENEDKYFRYYKIEFWDLIGFDRFLELIANDVIQITLMGRVSRSGFEKGRQRNKNMLFKIPKDKIYLLFYKIDSYNHDHHFLDEITYI